MSCSISIFVPVGHPRVPARFPSANSFRSPQRIPRTAAGFPASPRGTMRFLHPSCARSGGLPFLTGLAAPPASTASLFFPGAARAPSFGEHPIIVDSVLERAGILACIIRCPGLMPHRRRILGVRRRGARDADAVIAVDSLLADRAIQDHGAIRIPPGPGGSSLRSPTIPGMRLDQ